MKPCVSCNGHQGHWAVDAAQHLLLGQQCRLQGYLSSIASCKSLDERDPLYQHFQSCARAPPSRPYCFWGLRWRIPLGGDQAGGDSSNAYQVLTENAQWKHRHGREPQFGLCSPPRGTHHEEGPPIRQLPGPDCRLLGFCSIQFHPICF